MLSLARIELVSLLFRNHWLRHAVVLAVLGAFAFALFFIGAAERALWSSHEGRAAQHAQRMIDTGQWGMPTLYFGEADYQKPPLYYWLVAGLTKLRGGVVDSWAVRFPAGVAAIAGVWLMCVAGVAFDRTSTGFLAAVILACNLRYSWLARVGRIDMPLTVAVAGVLICFYAGYRRMTDSATFRREAWPWMAAAYLAASLAVMLKGPVGLALPGIPILTFLVWERRLAWPWQGGFRELMHRMGAWWGIPVVLMTAGPWFVWASVATDGAFFKTFFLHHHWDRTLGVEGLKPEPVWYYIPQVFLDMFPWSVLIPAAIWFHVRRAKAEQDAFGRFALCWSAGMFGFLSLVRFKRHDYLLPLVPGLALVLAGYWQQLFAADRTRREARWSLLFCAALAATACAIGGGSMATWNGSVARVLLETPIARHLLHETDRMLIGQLHAAIPQSSQALAPMALCGAMATGLSAWLVFRRRPMAAAVSIAVAWLVMFVAYVRCVLPPLEPLREQQTIATVAREYQANSSPVYYYGREDQQLMFYLGPRARWLPDRRALWPVITQADPVFVVMELDRFAIRQRDWPDVTMVPIARNTDNSCGMHRNPAVLVTNAVGWRLVQARRGAVDLRAN